MLDVKIKKIENYNKNFCLMKKVKIKIITIILFHFKKTFFKVYLEALEINPVQKKTCYSK